MFSDNAYPFPPSPLPFSMCVWFCSDHKCLTCTPIYSFYGSNFIHPFQFTSIFFFDFYYFNIFKFHPSCGCIFSLFFFNSGLCVMPPQECCVKVMLTHKYLELSKYKHAHLCLVTFQTKSMETLQYTCSLWIQHHALISHQTVTWILFDCWWQQD